MPGRLPCRPRACKKSDISAPGETTQLPTFISPSELQTANCTREIENANSHGSQQQGFTTSINSSFTTSCEDSKSITHGEVADFVGDVLDGVGDDHHAHVDQVGGGHLEHAGRELRDGEVEF